MSGRHVAWLILAYFLSSCGSPPENAVQQPPPANLAASPTSPPDFIPDSPVKAVKATKGEITIKRHNCLEVVGTAEAAGGVLETYEYCYYSYKTPKCATDLSECRSKPPSGKCKLNDPPSC